MNLLLTLQPVPQLGARLTGHKFESTDRVSHHCHLDENPFALLTTRLRGLSLGSRISETKAKAEEMRLITVKGAR